VGNLGIIYMSAGRVEDAIPLLEEVHRAQGTITPLRAYRPYLLDAYVRAADPAKPGDAAKIAGLMQELLADARAALPEDSPQLAGQLASFGQMLLQVKAWDEAEPLIREALTIREAKAPDDWRTFNTRSMLGEVLLRRAEFAGAERLLLEGYRGMKDREAAIPAQGKVRLAEALDRLVDLYAAWNQAEPGKGYDAKAAEWKAKAEALSDEGK
jgi:hypothetical protein